MFDGQIRRSSPHLSQGRLVRGISLSTSNEIICIIMEKSYSQLVSTSLAQDLMFSTVMRFNFATKHYIRHYKNTKLIFADPKPVEQINPTSNTLKSDMFKECVPNFSTF